MSAWRGTDIYRNGTEITSTASTTYLDTGLTTSTVYEYAVTAYDAAGNVSPQTSVAVTTLAQNPVVPVTPPPVVAANPTTTPPVSTPPPVTTPPVTPPPTPTFVFTTLLSFGSRGTAVQNLQLVLIQQGDLGANYATGYLGRSPRERCSNSSAYRASFAPEVPMPRDGAWWACGRGGR